MDIKIKHIDKRNWERVLKKDCTWMDIQKRVGVAYLIHIQEVTEPLILPCFGQNVKLADVGYYWLQLAFKDENFWLTVMYNEKGEFVQYYFDVTRKNFINSKESYFEDLYLDVVVHEGDKIEVLDLDELNEALLEQNISQQEYDFAWSETKKIMDNILKHRDECDKLCLRYFNILRKKLGREI